MPTMPDPYALPLTAQSADAVVAYLDGVDRVRAFELGGEALLRRALELDPDFAMAHAALAGLLLLLEQPDPAREHLARARALMDGLTDWERAHIEVRTLTSEGNPRALDAQLAHLEMYPRDAAVVGLVATTLGFGPRRDRREAMLALMERLAPAYGDDWFYLSQSAWAHQECDRLDDARRLAERALAHRPRSGSAVHSLAHVFYETDDHAGGAAFLDGWLADCERAMLFCCHFYWHLALAELARGRYGRVRELYETRIQPEVAEGSGRRGLTDGASLLWRLQLYQCAWGPLPWAEVCAAASRVTARPGMAFNDWHAALAYAAAGDESGLTRLADGLRTLDRAGHPTAGSVVLPLVEAIGAFGRGEYAACARRLEPLMGQIVRAGGSNAQREVIEDTLVEAYIREGEYDHAEVVLRRRLDRRSSARDAIWLDRARAGLGQQAEVRRHPGAGGMTDSGAVGWRGNADGQT